MATNGLHPLEALMRERIVVLDGAMGTMIQPTKLTEADYRGETLPRLERQGPEREPRASAPDAAAGDREDSSNYLEAGADIIETNTFSATTIGLARFSFSRRTDKRPQRSGILSARGG